MSVIKKSPVQFVMQTRTVMDFNLPDEKFSGVIFAIVLEKKATKFPSRQYRSINLVSVLPSSYSSTISMPTWESPLSFFKFSDAICAEMV